MIKYFPFLLLLFFTSLLSAQNAADTTASGIPGNLRIGVIASPPYCIKDMDGNWNGMSVELWRQVAERINVTYQLVEFSPQDSLTRAVEDGEVDVMLHMPITDSDEQRIDFVQAFHDTSLGIAMPQRQNLMSIVRAIFTMQFLWIVLSLSVALLIVGLIIYLIERGNNEDQFGGERTFWQGLGSGFWWAGVTMTTIGYGDKAPQSLAGRAVAMLWMLVALAVTSSLTAAIISAIDARQAIEFPSELKEKNVGVVVDSPAANYLDARGQEYTTFESSTKGLESLGEDELDVFIDDAFTLNYLTSRDDIVKSHVQKTDAEPESFAFGIADDSPLLEPINQAVIQITHTQMWKEIVANYTGSK